MTETTLDAIVTEIKNIRESQAQIGFKMVQAPVAELSFKLESDVNTRKICFDVPKGADIMVGDKIIFYLINIPSYANGNSVIGPNNYHSMKVYRKKKSLFFGTTEEQVGEEYKGRC